ncbi:hypothetical protein LVY72_09540 [Arthrobacter sp. I2-34]|uniref:DUF4232 domain-containing protein n=1 Tax=Arthrobacter hankyongi TaxID=2904801 RepID=A0ABS9L6A0_9MICC|nr:hypothetical protein [Arthrobacter hankyongi]MCG2622160.1 hypothetical protein [Arthrobacter hankyongi]
MVSRAPARVRRWMVPGVLLLAALGAACSPAGRPGPSSQAGASSPAPGPVTVQISQRRGQETKHRLILQIDNVSGGPVEISAAALHSPLYDGAAAWVPVRAGGTTLDAGSTVSLTVTLPAPRCGPPPTGAAGDAAAALTVKTAAGTARLRMAVPDPFGFLERSHTRDCLAEAAGRVAALTLAPRLEVSGSGQARSAVVGLRIAPAGGTQTLTLEAPAPTTLLEEDPAHPWPRNVVIAGTGGPRTLALHFVPARCDAHAVAEDRLGLKLPFRLAAGSYRGTLRLEPPPELERALYAFIASACAGGGPAVAPSGASSERPAGQ